MTLTDVVATGDHRKSLEALRNKLAADIDAGDGNTAALAKQLTDVLKTLASIAPLEVSKLDDLAKRRNARLGPQVSKRAGGGVARSGKGSGRAGG